MMLITMLRAAARLAVVALFAGLSAAAARAQAPPPPQQTVETDPIRCWWRTSAGAVRTGETFSLVLTCATLDNEAVQVVPDESRLGPSVIQMAPFETVGGGHPEDLRTADRRFFQYEYRLRMINPDYIGRDVPLPDLLLHYRVNSRLAGNAALEGRDQTYLLPHQVIRITAMVPADATDIRDTTDVSFGTVEGLRFRARALEIAAITLVVLGALMVALSLVRLITRLRHRRGAAAVEKFIGTSGVLRIAGRELSVVQRGVDAQGWTEPLVERALAATRIAGASGLGRTASQRLMTDTRAVRKPQDAQGWITHVSLRGSRTRRISSPVTSRDLRTRLDALPDSASPAARELLTQLQSALATFTAAQYSRPSELDRTALDRALSDAVDAVRRLKMRNIWPTVQLRRWLGRPVDVA
jgi:hypothetical protein